MSTTASANVRWSGDLGLAGLDQVGGKNSALGEIIAHLTGLGVRVPNGFATTADAYRRFIRAELIGLDTIAQPFPADLEADIRAAYDDLM